MTYRGDDIGRWAVRQARDWAQLNAEQRRRLEELGVRPRAAARAQKTHVRSTAKTGAGKGLRGLPTGRSGPAAIHRARRNNCCRAATHRGTTRRNVRTPGCVSEQPQEQAQPADRRPARHPRRLGALLGGDGRSSVMTARGRAAVQDAMRRHTRTRRRGSGGRQLGCAVRPGGAGGTGAGGGGGDGVRAGAVRHLQPSRTATGKPWQRAMRMGSPGSVQASTAAGPESAFLPDGHETSMEGPHWGRNSEGRPIAWLAVPLTTGDCHCHRAALKSVQPDECQFFKDAVSRRMRKCHTRSRRM